LASGSGPTPPQRVVVVGFERFMVLGGRGIHPLERFLKGFAMFPPLWPAFVSPTRFSVEHDVSPTNSVSR
jgi:hypothetical protein